MEPERKQASLNLRLSHGSASKLSSNRFDSATFSIVELSSLVIFSHSYQKTEQIDIIRGFRSTQHNQVKDHCSSDRTSMGAPSSASSLWPQPPIH